VKVLLLSQSALLSRHARRLVEDAGHALLTAADLDGCLRLTAAERPDVVLLCAHSAAEAAGALRDLPAPEDAAAPGIVVLSPDPADADAAHNAGAHFLGVPFPDEELPLILQVAARARKLVMLCDDSALILRHTAAVLSGAGYDVCSAQDGAQGLALAAEVRPDLVITDVEMPRVDGYTLCRALKARFPRVPVIICSALGEAHDLERGFDAGADDYLVKPAQPGELLSRVAPLLRQGGPGSRSGPGGGLPPRERLLVVDDSPTVRQLIVESLRRQGFQVISAVDGEAGLRLARAERPEMIITDYDMPRMTGFEMVHALKQDGRTRDIPVMMLTARSGRRDQAQMRAVGLAAYLVKPFAVDRCVATVERVLAERRLRAYKDASRLYISDAAVRAAEQVAQSGDLSSVRATEAVVAVLFADLSGFTALSAERTPREVVELLNAHFDALCPIIRRQGGDIDKFIGDCVMAIFEDRPGAEPAPLRAVRAGLLMQEATARAREQGGARLGMRVGINTGPVVRGDIGARNERRDYTVVGDVVNRAQRLEGSAPVGGVLIGESTFLAVRGQVRCEEQSVRLKGVAGPVRAYLVRELLPAEGAGAEGDP
jgi:DNA-binding response OmpR family regulator